MAEEQLHGAEVLRAAIDQRRLCPAHRVGAVRGVIQSDRCDPSMRQARILTRRNMRCRPLSFPLHDRCPAGDLEPVANVANPQLRQIARAQFEQTNSLCTQN
jgi:hypothetical protein